MPAVRSARNRKPPPDGFDDLEDTLLEFSNKMKDAENASHEGKKRQETLWPIFQISHQRKACGNCLPTLQYADNMCKDQGISMSSTMTRKPSRNSFTTGCSKMDTPTVI